MIREFECKKCEKLVEAISLSKEKDNEIINNPPRCDKCKRPMELVKFSLSYFQLKGSGWYKPSQS